MGHTRLGKIPKSQKWTSVVQMFAQTEISPQVSRLGIDVGEVAEIARRTIEAADGGLKEAINDSGLRYTFYLLTQIALASRTENWQQSLVSLNIHLSTDATIQDLTSELQNNIDDYIFSNGKRSDVSEMAQQAAGEAILSLASDKAATLFGSDLEDVRLAVRSLSTKKGFSDLGQKFFGSFMARFLNFYLSRVTATHINNPTVNDLGELNRFNSLLRQHCDQSARIVRDFSGEWYSKTEYVSGISVENTGGFISVALKKLQAELQQQGRES